MWSCHQLKTDVVQETSTGEGDVVEEDMVEMITDLHLVAVEDPWEVDNRLTKEEIPFTKVEVEDLGIVTHALITMTTLMTEATIREEGGGVGEGGTITPTRPTVLEEAGVVEGDSMGTVHEGVGHHVTMVVEITRVAMTTILIAPAATVHKEEEAQGDTLVVATEREVGATETTTPGPTTTREDIMKVENVKAKDQWKGATEVVEEGGEGMRGDNPLQTMGMDHVEEESSREGRITTAAERGSIIPTMAIHKRIHETEEAEEMILNTVNIGRGPIEKNMEARMDIVSTEVTTSVTHPVVKMTIEHPRDRLIIARKGSTRATRVEESMVMTSGRRRSIESALPTGTIVENITTGREKRVQLNAVKKSTLNMATMTTALVLSSQNMRQMMWTRQAMSM